MRRSPVRISFAFVLGLSLALILLWLLGGGLPAAHAIDLKVCVEGLPTCPYASIQAAVDAAVTGDVIKVAAGTYTTVTMRPRNDITTTGDVTQVVYLTKTVTIRGGYTTTNWETPDPVNQPTILDAGGQGRVIYVTGDIAPTIEGLRLTGGNAAGLGGLDFGALYDAGGGVYIITASATLSGCQVYDNIAGVASTVGGGVHLRAAAQIYNNRIFSNTAEYGGGAFVDQGLAMLNGNTFALNTASLNGGGVFLYQSAVALNENTVISNTAQGLGGGLISYSGNDVLTNTVIADNTAATNGSGMYVSSAASPRLLHATIARNTGGDGSGVYVDATSTAALTNTILVSQDVGVWVDAGGVATLESTLWNGNTADSVGNVISGTHNYTGSPAFVNPNVGNYHLGAGSAAIDRGVDAGVATDLDGIARPQGSQPDLGAYEAAANLTISKIAVPASANPGDYITFTLAFANIGAHTATGVLITDIVPISVTSVNVFSSGVVITQSSPGYVWEVQDLAPGQGGIITITAALSKPLAASLFTNTATIVLAKADSNPGNNYSEAGVTVNNVAPVAVDDAYNTDEDTTKTVAAPGVLINDSDDNDDPLTAGLDVGPASGALTLGADGSFIYTPTADYNGVVTFTYRANDGLLNSNLAVVTITVNAVNDAPMLTPANPTMTSITEDDTSNGGMLISAIVGASISDVDAGALEGIAIYDLVSGNGTWEYSTDGGGSWNAAGAVVTTSALLLRDTDRVRFVPNGENGTTASFSYFAWDRTSGAFGTKVDATTRGGTTAFSSAGDTASITVTSVNDAPVLDIAGDMALTAINEDDVTNTGTLVSGIIASAGGDRITDVDTSAVEGIAVTGVDNTNGAWEYSTNGSGGPWTAFGTPSGSAARLLASDANTRVRFVPNANYNGTVDPGITFRAWDQTSGSNGGAADTTTNGGTTAFSTATETASITVNAVNDAPVNTVPGAQTTAEDTALTFSIGGGNAITISDPDVGSNAAQIILTATNGALTLNGVTGLTFSTGDGTADATMTFTGTITDVNAALNGMVFSPTANYAGSASVQITTNDLGNTGVGGPKTDTDTVNITVTPVNDAPMFTSTPVTAATRDVAYTYPITAADVDAGDALTITATTKPGWLTLTDNHDGTATLSGTPSGADVGEHPIILQVRDTGGLTNTQSFTITVTTNSPPSISDIPDQVTMVGKPVGPITFIITDTDTLLSSLTLTRTSSNTSLVPLANITFGGSGMTRTVTLTPTAGLTGTATITVTVSDGTTPVSDAFVLTVSLYKVYLPLTMRSP